MIPRPRKPASPFRYFHSSPEVIRLVVIMYVRFSLRLWNVEDLLFERGIDGTRMVTYGGGKPGYWQEPVPKSKRLFLRIENDRHIVTYFYSVDDRTWTRQAIRAEVSGVHANTMVDLVQLQPALLASGEGDVRVRSYLFAALQGT